MPKLTYPAVRTAAKAQGHTIAQAAAYLGMPELALADAAHDVAFGQKEKALQILSGDWTPPGQTAPNSPKPAFAADVSTPGPEVARADVVVNPKSRLKISHGSSMGDKQDFSRLKLYPRQTDPEPSAAAAANEALGVSDSLTGGGAVTAPANVCSRDDAGSAAPPDDERVLNDTAVRGHSAGGGVAGVKEPTQSMIGVPLAAERGGGSADAAIRGTEQNTAAGPLFRRASDVRPEPVDWLLPGLIPIGALTVVAGDTSVGKSLFGAFVTAAVTTGADWPGRCGSAPIGDVWILAAEDDHNTTVLPRLMAAGADTTRVYLPDPDELRASNISLPDLIRKAMHGRPAIKLIIIDVLAEFVDGRDLSRNDRMRTLAQELQTIAREKRVAVLAVTHTNKRGGRGIGQLAGAQSIYAVARSTLKLQAHPREPGQYVVVPFRDNLGPAESLTYRIGPRAVRNADGTNCEAAALVFLPDAPAVSRDEIEHALQEAEPNALQEAILFLNTELANGPLLTTELSARARAAGISAATLRRARSAVCNTRKAGMDDGWVVELKAAKALIPTEGKHAHEHEHLRDG